MSQFDFKPERTAFSILAIIFQNGDLMSFCYVTRTVGLEDPMRHLGWLFAIAVAVLALQVGKNTNSGTLSVSPLSTDAMQIGKIQMQADRNLPVTVIDNPI